MEPMQPGKDINKSVARPTLLLFDVYETLLDMSSVEKKVNILLDNKRGYALWFELFMQYCFVDNCIEQFNPFPDIAKATLQMAGKIFGKKIAVSEVDDILLLLKHLPVKEGVSKGLSLLHTQGYRMAALTNSAQQIVEDRMERTGLISYFEKVLSAQHVGKYKPSLEVYQWAIKQLNVAATDVLLISAHGWDIAGACNAGMHTAYIVQDSQMLYPLAPIPALQARSIEGLAQEMDKFFS